MAGVTPHFKIEEFDQRAWHGGSRVAYPAKWVTSRLTPLCQALEVLRAELGGRPFHVLSGYRSEEMNKAIGGARHSQHVEGRAADIRVDGVPADRVHAVALSLCMAGRIPAIRGLGKYATFVHLDVRPTVRLVRWGDRSSEVIAWTPSQ